jgi:hypothetical protein
MNILNLAVLAFAPFIAILVFLLLVIGPVYFYLKKITPPIIHQDKEVQMKKAGSLRKKSILLAIVGVIFLNVIVSFIFSQIPGSYDYPFGPLFPAIVFVPYVFLSVFIGLIPAFIVIYIIGVVVLASISRVIFKKLLSRMESKIWGRVTCCGRTRP